MFLIYKVIYVSLKIVFFLQILGLQNSNVKRIVLVVSSFISSQESLTGIEPMSFIPIVLYKSQTNVLVL